MRRACEAAYAYSMHTVALLQMHELAPCMFCSVADFMAAVTADPLLLPQLLARPGRVARLVMRHTPARHAAEAFAALRATTRALAMDARASARARDEAAAAAATAPAPAGAAHTPARSLLGLPDAFAAAGDKFMADFGDMLALHTAYSDSLSSLDKYEVGSYFATEMWDRDVFRPTQYATTGACPPLMDLVLFLRNATLDTQAYYVNALAPPPPTGFRWPEVPRSPAPNISAAEAAATARMDAALDPVAGAAVAAVRRLMTVLGLTVHYVHDVVMALVREQQLFQKCDLRSVQTCERWNMRLHDGVMLAIGYVSSTLFLLSAVRLSLLSNLLIGLGLWTASTTGVMYICYGYSPRCAPLVPTCFVRDVYTTIESIFPRRLTVPYALFKSTATTPKMLEVCQTWLTTDCLTQCVDAPFLYRDWRDVLAWTAAEIDSDALSEQLRSLSASVPFGLADGVPASLEMKRNVYRLGDAPTVSANRICAMLRSYTALPAMVLTATALLLALQASNFAFTLAYSALAVVASVAVSVFTV